jgi:two-component system LytT family sensor kinase
MIETSGDKLIRTGWRGWLILYGSWTLPALLISAAYFMFQGAANMKWNWFNLFLDQLVVFNFFGSLCPPVYRLSFRFRFTRSRWPVTLVIHIFIALLAAAVFLILCGILAVVVHSKSLSLIDSIKKQFISPHTLLQGLGSIFYYIIVVGVMALIRSERQRKLQETRSKELELRATRLETQLTHAKLHTLKMQLHPHFFFNALNSISALVESKQNDLAFKTIAQLGDLLRAALESPDTRTIPLRRELGFIEKYLAIERIRFSHRLKTETSIPDNCLDALLPALILQPLVENCIRYALSVQPGTVKIGIAARKEDSNLVLEVSDDGPGLPPGWGINTHAGIGLKNVRERLQFLYGESCGLTLLPANPKGVTVQLIIPYSLTPVE